MSSTNRSNARNEHIADYYVTPISDIELFLKSFQKVVPLNWNNSIIVDPTSGGNPKTDKDAYHPMSYPTAIKNIYGDCEIHTYDLREDSFAENKCDYLNEKLSYKPNIIITNPPFAIATDIIEKALQDVDDDGYVIMLLRLNFFGSQSREWFFEKYMPEWALYIISELVLQIRKIKMDIRFLIKMEYLNVVVQTLLNICTLFGTRVI